MLGLRWQRDERELRQRLGIQLQETQFTDKLTVEETIRLFRSFYDRGRTVDELLALVELESKRSSCVVKLSGGQKQRLSVACALVGDPDMLFLDEPAPVSIRSRAVSCGRSCRRFRAGGGTILLTTHYMDEAEVLCDRVAVVDHGTVIALDTPKALITSLGAPKTIVHEGTLEDVFMTLTGRHLRRVIRCRSPGRCRDEARASAARADARPAARVRPRARSAVLDVLLPDDHVGGDGAGVSLARCAAGSVGLAPGDSSCAERWPPIQASPFAT